MGASSVGSTGVGESSSKPGGVAGDAAAERAARHFLASSIEANGGKLGPEILETYRAYLLLIANRQLSPGLRTLVGASDLVQESLLEAQQSIENVALKTEPQLLAWLKRILFNNLADAARRHGKTIERTISLDHPQGDNSSAVGLVDLVAHDQPSPSRGVIADEETSRLMQAVERLPAEYRKMIQLRNFELLTFEEIGTRLGKNAGTVCRMWYKAIGQLRNVLRDSR